MAGEKLLLTGNEAIARGAWEAGVSVATAYPGTPSTEILESISKYSEIYSEWGTNEKVAYEVAYGAAIAGKRAIACMKQVGLNVAADPFFTSSYTGINGGFVLISADEPGVFSSQNEQDNRNYAHAAKVPMLEPSDSEECRLYVKKAFEISEKFDTPVIVRMTTRACHTHSPVNSENRVEVEKKAYVKDAVKRSMIPIYALKRHEVVEKRLKTLSEFNDSSELNSIYNKDAKSEYCIITSGIAFTHVMEVCDNIPVLKLGFTYPLPVKFIEDFIKNFKKIIVIEENDDFLLYQLRFNLPEYSFHGKPAEYIINELNADRVKEIIEFITSKKSNSEKNINSFDISTLPPRPPQFCPGCPHRATFYTIAKHKIPVTGDIGCYGLGVLPPFSGMDTILCMGASVTMAHGFSLSGEKAVGIIGDSTFFHTGINGLINTYYNKGISTIIILDNSITAMTGGQINPASFTSNTVNVKIEDVVKGIGIKNVHILDSYELKNIDSKIRECVQTDELNVIIVKNPCVLIKKEKNEKKYMVNQNNCVKCKMCLKVGCPAITVDNGNVSIIEDFCAGCGVCAAVCPKGAII